MARGITQDQVNDAAEAILAAGESPTVEKIRVELGTGSPNTITRMLDTRRSKLGDRLRQRRLEAPRCDHAMLPGWPRGISPHASVYGQGPVGA